MELESTTESDAKSNGLGEMMGRVGSGEMMDRVGGLVDK